MVNDMSYVIYDEKYNTHTHIYNTDRNIQCENEL